MAAQRERWPTVGLARHLGQCGGGFGFAVAYLAHVDPVAVGDEIEDRRPVRAHRRGETGDDPWRVVAEVQPPSPFSGQP